MLGNFSCFCECLSTFVKIHFSKNSFNAIQVSNSLDPDQDQYSVGPDLGSNCLQKLSADAVSKERVKCDKYKNTRDFLKP